MVRTTTGFVPAAPEDADALRKIKLGSTVRARFTQPRNIGFHRKFFAMLDIGFDAWEPPEREYNGLPVQKNRERFRKDCIIAAGFFEPVANLLGEVRAEAHSISFANMDQTEFERVYSAVADVILQKVLRNYTRADLDRVVDEILRFA
jgi:hypothetical protein